MAARTFDSTALVFRLHESAPQLVREVLLERGWMEYNEQEQEEGDWNLYWRASAFRSADFTNVLPWQRLNHHPKTLGITRKDHLARNLKRMRGTFGSALYNFSPTAYILPNNYTAFLAEYTKSRLRNTGKSGYWICKPVDLSRGRGIFIFEDIKDLLYDSPVIVQRYISNPLLISGYKFDLRIYVCVKSFHPLTIYIHQDGLVRFATERYNLSSLDNPFSHLTNTSINKLGPCYRTAKQRVGLGCKWTMNKFRCFLHSQDIDERLLWQRINNIVTLTLLTIAPSVPSSPNCVELFGFDILIDANLKPWLLEVNYSPALTLDCAADVTVKKDVLNDLIDLMNYKKVDVLRQKALLPPKSKSLPRQQSKSPSSLHSNVSLPFVQQKQISSPEKIVMENKRVLLPERVKQNSRHSSRCLCKLPAIHVQKYRLPTFSWSAKSQENGKPPSRVGGFILTFPFNEVTLKASKDNLNVKIAVQEVHKRTAHKNCSGTVAASQSSPTGIDLQWFSC
uniref:Tubulin tyrosine ligase-like family, member 2 n=1 Tax=Paramormyrops kingsleyae TaxID=1676925 RepID=A0A3B3T0J7_9TELE